MSHDDTSIGPIDTSDEMGTQVIAKLVPNGDTEGAIVRDLDMSE